MLKRIATVALLLALSLVAGAAPPEDHLAYRQRVAAADMPLACQWMASAYDIPERVPQEILIKGYDYADTLTALAFMSEGGSLNRILEVRQNHLWPQVAENLRLDPRQLPEPIYNILTFGRNFPPPPALRFLPDVRPGLAERIKLPAFSSTVPGPEMVEEFRLNGRDIENIRYVLNDPLGVPDEDLLLPAGKDLRTGDWVMAGCIQYLKPFPMQTVLETRRGVKIGWPEVALVFSLRPDVLTEGPMAAIYPIMSGTHPNGVLAGRKRQWLPQTLPLNYDLERLTVGERAALEPLMWRNYRATPGEIELLKKSNLDLTERAIALALTRQSQIDLETFLTRHAAGETWSQLITRYAIDMRGQWPLAQSIAVREPAVP